MNELIKRLKILEDYLVPDTCFLMVKLPDGTEREANVEEWYAHRKEWEWTRVTRGADLNALNLIFAWMEEIGSEKKAREYEEAYYKGVHD